MTLAYYARSATQAFWAEHWGGHTPEALARVAETSPLTDLILRHLPPAPAPILEAGCGLGQYVVLLRGRGYHAVGADWAVDPLRVCRAWAKDTPLVAMDLGQLAFGAGAFGAYVSLGVVEHDAGGPDRILAEAHRVLAPGGTLLVSVPYVNVVRRLGARRIRRANERVRVAGNLKFDAPIAADAQELTDALQARFGFNDERPLIIAASTHAPEETWLLEAFKLLRSSLSNSRPRLLIAPRHPERFNEVAALIAASSFSWTRRSSAQAASDLASDVILLDSIGELRAVFTPAALVFVGGSLVPTGGHNVLEPAAHAKCIITGAHTFNFTAIVRDFIKQQALVQLPAVDERQAPPTLARTFQELLTDDERRRAIGTRARAALEQSRGATARTVALLTPLLNKFKVQSCRFNVQGQANLER